MRQNVLTYQICPHHESEIHGLLCHINKHTHSLAVVVVTFFHVTFCANLDCTGQPTWAISQKNYLSLCVWAPYESRGVSKAAGLMTPFTASWTPTGATWNCSNSSRIIQSLMRRTTHTVSRSTTQSLLRGRWKVIKYLLQQVGPSPSNQTNVKDLFKAKQNSAPPEEVV